MSWIAVLLVGIAVADLAHTVRPARVVNECVGAAAAVWLGLLAGLTDPADLVALLVIAAVTVAWGQTVTRAFAGGRAWIPLLVLGTALGVGVLVSGIPGPAGGLVGDWLDDVGLPVLQGLSTDRALLLLGAFLVQLSTGNVLVRLVLAATDTVNPPTTTPSTTRSGAQGRPAARPHGARVHLRPRPGRPVDRRRGGGRGQGTAALARAAGRRPPRPGSTG